MAARRRCRVRRLGLLLGLVDLSPVFAEKAASEAGTEMVVGCSGIAAVVEAVLVVTSVIC